MSGVISGSDGLTKNGSGVLDLEAANTYTGTTAIDGGTLQVDGTVGAVTPGTDTTLAGAGTVASIITTAATISPGGSSLGVLKDTGPLTLDAKSFFDPTINNGTAGTGYSQLNVAGAINLANATLDVTLSPSFTPTSGEQFTILNNTGSARDHGELCGPHGRGDAHDLRPAVHDQLQGRHAEQLGGADRQDGLHGHLERGRCRQQPQLVRHRQLAQRRRPEQRDLTSSSRRT